MLCKHMYLSRNIAFSIYNMSVKSTRKFASQNIKTYRQMMCLEPANHDSNISELNSYFFLILSCIPCKYRKDTF